MHSVNNIQIEAIWTCQCHVKRGCKINVSGQVDSICVNAKRQFGTKLRCQCQITLG